MIEDIIERVNLLLDKARDDGNSYDLQPDLPEGYYWVQRFYDLPDDEYESGLYLGRINGNDLGWRFCTDDGGFGWPAIAEVGRRISEKEQSI